MGSRVGKSFWSQEKTHLLYYAHPVNQSFHYQHLSGWWGMTSTYKSTLMNTDCFLGFEMFSRKLCHFFWIEVRLTSLWLRQLFSLHFLKIGVISAFVQSSRTSPDCHELSQIIGSNLAMALATSLSPQKCIPWGCMDLCLSSLFKYSLTWSSYTSTSYLHLQKVLPGFLEQWSSTAASYRKC